VQDTLLSRFGEGLGTKGLCACNDEAGEIALSGNDGRELGEVCEGVDDEVVEGR
jgi:hypothetical protein